MLICAAAIFRDVERTLPSHSIWHKSRVGAFMTGVATEGMVRPLPKKQKRDNHCSSWKSRPTPFFYRLPSKRRSEKGEGIHLHLVVIHHRREAAGDLGDHTNHGWISEKTITLQKQQKHTEKDTWIPLFMHNT